MALSACSDQSPVANAPAGYPCVGPRPGAICTSRQYLKAQEVQNKLAENQGDPAREVHYRIHGIQFIDTLRLRLNLPVSTYNTACTYFHKFRLDYSNTEYNYQDAAVAALLLACKVEDTIKKPKEILCAAYNLRNPEKLASPDDKVLAPSHAVIVALERHILETIAFDFRTRHPHTLLPKFIPLVVGQDVATTSSEYRSFCRLVFDITIDLYKTSAPIKQTSACMAIAVVKLAARLTDRPTDRLEAIQLGSSIVHDSGAVTETVFDLLELYAQSQKSTRVGPLFNPGRFVQVRLDLNRDIDRHYALRLDDWCLACQREMDKGIGMIDNNVSSNNNNNVDSSNSANKNTNKNMTNINNTTNNSNGNGSNGNNNNLEAFPSPASQSHTNGTKWRNSIVSVNGRDQPYTTSPDAAAPTATSPSSNLHGLSSSMRRSRAGQDSTLRYVFDHERAKDEEETVIKYRTQQWEEYEVEVEEEVEDEDEVPEEDEPPRPPPPPPAAPSVDRDRGRDRSDRDRGYRPGAGDGRRGCGGGDGRRSSFRGGRGGRGHGNGNRNHESRQSRTGRRHGPY